MAVRIASFLPTGTAICYELGLASSLRGVTFECYNPPEAKSKRKVVSCIFDQDKLSSSEIDAFVSQCSKDGTSMYSIDEVMLREEGVNVVIAQDLCNVCAINSSSMVASMDRLRADVPDLQVVFLRAQSLDGMYADVLAVADACGVGERGRAMVASMVTRVDRVRQAVSGCPPVRVCCLEWLDPLYNGGHWLPEMVEFAGGVDPLAAKPKGYSVAMDFARLSEAQPDVLVLMPCGFTLERTLTDGRALAEKPLWGTLPAVQNRQVWAVHGNRLFSGSSPALVDGLEVLAKILHPEQMAWLGRDTSADVANLNHYPPLPPTAAAAVAALPFLARVRGALALGLKLCILVRGLPGRGKTTLAHAIADHVEAAAIGSSSNGSGGKKAVIAAADDFFTDAAGQYVFKAEWLGLAHAACADTLVEALQDDGVVCAVQHNTNCMAWEGAALRERAEGLGALVAHVEPQHAWVAAQADLPTEALQRTLVNGHGVPPERLLDMVARREPIVPRYLAYWLTAAAFLRACEASGAAAGAVAEFLVASRRRHGQVADGVADAHVATAASTEEAALAMLSPLLHVTCDYIGSDPAVLSAADHSAIDADALDACPLHVLALYADKRGVGAYVTGGRGVDTAPSPDGGDAPTPLPADPVPRFQRYTKAQRAAARRPAVSPHMTLMVHPGAEAYMVGEAAAEAEPLILAAVAAKRARAVAERAAARGDGSDRAAPGPAALDVQQFAEFSLAVFGRPVRVTAVYAASYTKPAVPAGGDTPPSSPAAMVPGTPNKKL